MSERKFTAREVSNEEFERNLEPGGRISTKGSTRFTYSSMVKGDDGQSLMETEKQQGFCGIHIVACVDNCLNTLHVLAHS
jgi:hypothetical protein